MMKRLEDTPSPVVVSESCEGLVNWIKQGVLIVAPRMSVWQRACKDEPFQPCMSVTQCNTVLAYDRLDASISILL